MNEELKVLPIKFEDREVHYLNRRNSFWFLAEDVCACIRSDQWLKSLPTDEKDGQLVSELGVYRLVILTRSPIAEQFKAFIAYDLMPNLRVSFNERWIMNDDMKTHLQEREVIIAEAELLRTLDPFNERDRAVIGFLRKHWGPGADGEILEAILASAQ